MLINVPQYIDVEDKIAGPLTMKQLGWLIGLGIILLIMWNTLPSVIFFVVGFPVAIIFSALAFYKPYGQPLGSFVVFAVMYYFRPKIYVWKRTPEKEKAVEKINQVQNVQIVDKKMTRENLESLAQLLDSEGSQYNENIDEVLKKYKVKNKNLF